MMKPGYLWTSLLTLAGALMLFQNCSGRGVVVRADGLSLKVESSGNGDGYGGKIYASVDTSHECSGGEEGQFAIKEKFEFRAEGLVQTAENCAPLAEPRPRPDLTSEGFSTDGRLLVVGGKLLERIRPNWTDRVAVDDFVDVYCRAIGERRGDVWRRFEILLSRVSDTIILTPQRIEPAADAPSPGPGTMPGPPAGATPPPDIEVRVRSARVNLQWATGPDQYETESTIPFARIHEPVFPQTEGIRFFHSAEDAGNPGMLMVNANVQMVPNPDPNVQDFRMRLDSGEKFEAKRASCWQAR